MERCIYEIELLEYRQAVKEARRICLNSSCIDLSLYKHLTSLQVRVNLKLKNFRHAEVFG